MTSTSTGSDQGQAAREAEARARLLAAGATDLPRPPWQHRDQPPSAVDLIRYALWRAAGKDAGGGGKDAGGGGKDAGGGGGLAAALALLPAARAETDQIEAALLFTARAAGMSWPQISRAMGLGSAQAAQQRFDRVSGRAGRREGA